MSIDEIVQSLQTVGVVTTTVSDFLNDDIIFEKTGKSLDKMISQEDVVSRSEMLRLGAPIRDRTKFFEFQNKQLFGGAMSLDNSEIIQFYLNDMFLDVAEEYLETREVRIRNCLAFYHPENPFPPANSQNWHRDTEDTRILKVFVYYNDVTEHNGSLWYVKNSKHMSKNDNIWPNVGKAKHGYLDLESTMKIPYNDVMKIEGKAGTICFFDANGFHKGGNVKKGHRLSTHCCYLRSDAPHIVNGILPTFDYDPNINILNRESSSYSLLPERKKKVLQ
jgi:hypothetical protein